MEKQSILQGLLSLSKIHHQLVIEEKWAEWESVANQKEGFYRNLEELKAIDFDEEEKRILLEIGRLEKQTKNELKKKKHQARQGLIRVNQVKSALKGYGKINKKGSGKHFGIKC